MFHFALNSKLLVKSSLKSIVFCNLLIQVYLVPIYLVIILMTNNSYTKWPITVAYILYIKCIKSINHFIKGYKMQLFYPLNILCPRKKVLVAFLLYETPINMLVIYYQLPWYLLILLKPFHMLRFPFIVNLKASV